MSDLTVAEIVERLGMQPHPEGGYFVETWRSDELARAGGLPDRYAADRPLGTSIYYLLTPEGFSAMHRIRSDEVWHYHAGCAVEVLLLGASGVGETVRLGMDLAAGERPQLLVPRGTWQGACVAEGGAWSLVGCTVTPGFAFEDFELGRGEELLGGWPEHAEALRQRLR